MVVFMDKNIDLSEVNLYNQNFWGYFFKVNFPNAYIDDEDLSLDEILDPYEPVDELEWTNTFTQYYDGVFDETDGYLDTPTVLETKISSDKTLKIEFHPGDTLYYINEVEIGSTGPHWKLHVLSYSIAKSVLSQKDGTILFLLLLPLVYVTVDEINEAQVNIKEVLPMIFPKNICVKLTSCILSGLTKV